MDNFKDKDAYSGGGRGDRGDRGGDRGDRGGDRGDRGAGDGKGPPRRGRFGRKKVCPFILDKNLVLDFKNIRMVQRFITETGKIVPRHVSGVNAKNQRRLTKQIKRARNLGLIAPLTDG
jgi:small subunit ribosomal protein S18